MRLNSAVLLMLSGYAHASCASISDSDQRYYCNARAGVGSCAGIRNSGLRIACNAETASVNVRGNVRGNVNVKGSGNFSGSCAAIGDRDQRYYCNAKAGNGSCAGISNSDLRSQCNALNH